MFENETLYIKFPINYMSNTEAVRLPAYSAESCPAPKNNSHQKKGQKKVLESKGVTFGGHVCVLSSVHANDYVSGIYIYIYILIYLYIHIYRVCLIDKQMMDFHGFSTMATWSLWCRFLGSCFHFALGLVSWDEKDPIRPYQIGQLINMFSCGEPALGAYHSCTLKSREIFQPTLSKPSCYR